MLRTARSTTRSPGPSRANGRRRHGDRIVGAAGRRRLIFTGSDGRDCGDLPDRVEHRLATRRAPVLQPATRDRNETPRSLFARVRHGHTPPSTARVVGPRPWDGTAMGEKGNLTGNLTGGSYPGSDQSKLPSVPRFGLPPDAVRRRLAEGARRWPARPGTGASRSSRELGQGPGRQPGGDWAKVPTIRADSARRSRHRRRRRAATEPPRRLRRTAAAPQGPPPGVPPIGGFVAAGRDRDDDEQPPPPPPAATSRRGSSAVATRRRPATDGRPSVSKPGWPQAGPPDAGKPQIYDKAPPQWTGVPLERDPVSGRLLSGDPLGRGDKGRSSTRTPGKTALITARCGGGGRGRRRGRGPRRHQRQRPRPRSHGGRRPDVDARRSRPRPRRRRRRPPPPSRRVRATSRSP